MRVVIGSISHDTNTFSNVSTDLDKFRDDLYLGQDILTAFKGKHAIASAFIEVAEAEGFDLIPTVWARATPSGMVTDEAFTYLLSHLIEPLESAGTVDGVLLHLHGAMVTQSIDDPEGEVLETIRGIVGPKTPIISTLDLHANIAARMVREADILVGYDTYPHVDLFERGREATQLMADMLMERLTPTMAMTKPPMLVSPQRQKTNYHPMNALINLAHEMEADEPVVNVTVAGGYPFADVDFAGMTMLVTTNHDPALAQARADQLATFAWKLRRDFLARVVPVKEAVADAMATPGGPVVLADHADNPGGGAPCDGTVLLRTMLDLGVENAVLAVLADPEAVNTMAAAGVGTMLTLRLGGKTDALHGSPLEVTGTVKLISNGKFLPLGPMASGLESNMGRTVVFTCRGVDVIVTEKRLQPTDLELYRSVGIEPTRKKILAVKSAVHFRASHEPIAKKIIEVDAPGIHSARLSAFPYKKLRRPLFPLDVELLGLAELKQTLED